jgi:hypothetical protein
VDPERDTAPCDSVEVEYEDGALYIRLRSGRPAPLSLMLQQLGLLECLPDVQAKLRVKVPHDVLSELPRLMASPHDQ